MVKLGIPRAPGLTQLLTAWSMHDEVYSNTPHPNLIDCIMHGQHHAWATQSGVATASL